MGNFDHLNKCQNTYFDMSDSKYDKERALISLFINEYYNKFGVCMDYYITSYDVKYDRIFGEDNNRRYVRNFEINGYINLPKEEHIWTKFGIEGIDEVIVWVSKRHFDAASTDVSGQTYPKPQIGDIIKTEYSNYFYEITNVVEDTGQYLQSNQYIWEISMKPMKDEFIATTSATSASDISMVTNLDDIFNIDTNVDIEKENIIYDPEPGEQPNKDPFGNW